MAETLPTRRSIRILDGICLLLLCTAVLAYASYRADNRFFRNLGDLVLAGSPAGGPEACLKLLAFSSSISVASTLPGGKLTTGVQLYYRLSPLKPDPRTVLRHGTDPRGPCGSRSRVLAALLRSQGIPARLTALHAEGKAVHTIVEARCGGEWVPLDPTYNLYFEDDKGALLSVSRVREDPVVFRRAVAGRQSTHVPYRADYPADEYTYDDVYPFNWEAVPVLLPIVERVLGRLVAPDRLHRLVRWPDAYHRPKLFLAQAAIGAWALLFILRLYLVRRTTRRGHVSLPAP